MIANRILLIFGICFLVHWCSAQSYICDKIVNYPNGKIQEQSVTDSNVCKVSMWYKNGQLQSIYSHANGVFIGKSVSYCKNGLKKSEIDYDNNKLTTFYILFCNGDTQIVANCIGNPGCLVGDFTEYHQNGKRKIYGSYDSAKDCASANVKIGGWIYQNKRGKIVKQEIFVNGLLERIITSY